MALQVAVWLGKVLMEDESGEPTGFPDKHGPDNETEPLLRSRVSNTSFYAVILILIITIVGNYCLTAVQHSNGK